ncbi:DUF4184 family protein, partial [Streptomyces chitinivorans]
MPFTLSHAAAALPGIRADGRGRGPLVASALVAGTLAPDAAYYAASLAPWIMRLGEYTHSALGTVTVDVLIAAVLLGVWLLLREPLTALLPEGARGRAYALTRGEPWRGRPPAGLLLRCWASAALGAATHVLWDSFTHMDQWGVRWITVLDERVLGVPLYHQLQYGGSAVALVVLAAFLVRAWRGLPHCPAPALPVFSVLSARGRAGAAALLGAAAGNIGLTAVIDPGDEALTRGRLVHVDQYYLRADTIAAANAKLIEAQARVPIVSHW